MTANLEGARHVASTAQPVDRFRVDIQSLCGGLNGDELGQVRLQKSRAAVNAASSCLECRVRVIASDYTATLTRNTF